MCRASVGIAWSGQYLGEGGEAPPDLPVVLAASVSASILDSLLSAINQRNLRVRIVAISLTRIDGDMHIAANLSAAAANLRGSRAVRSAEEITVLGAPITIQRGNRISTNILTGMSLISRGGGQARVAARVYTLSQTPYTFSVSTNGDALIEVEAALTKAKIHADRAHMHTTSTTRTIRPGDDVGQHGTGILSITTYTLQIHNFRQTTFDDTFAPVIALQNTARSSGGIVHVFLQ